MQETQECLSPSVDHLPDFKRAESGMCSWLCKLCGEWITEFEDSQP